MSGRVIAGTPAMVRGIADEQAGSARGGEHLAHVRHTVLRVIVSRESSYSFPPTEMKSLSGSTTSSAVRVAS
jgi:hypothetical protein